MRPNPLSDLPKQWLELSAYDLVFLSLEDLEQLQSTPESAMAIEHWTKAGHSLYVYDPDEGVIAEGLDRVDAVLHGEFAGWQAGVVPNANRIEEYDNHSQRNGARKTLGFAQRDRSCDFLRIRNCGLGRVVFISGDPYEMQYRDRVAVLDVVGIQNWAWRERFGVSMTSNNSVFWKNLIPGIGLPPVNSFLLVMSLFVLTVGPASYYVLRRTKRLFLILIVTPAASLAMLCGLLVFAVVSDGFGVQTQVRGLTFLDSKTGRASSLSYQTYYSSIGGASELRFPDDATVFPVKFQPRDYRRRGRLNRTEWNAGQRLSGAYLRPRTMTQFLVSRSASSSMVAGIEEEGESLEFANGLQSPVELIFARRDDQFYWAENIVAGGSVALTRIGSAELAWFFPGSGTGYIFAICHYAVIAIAAMVMASVAEWANLAGAPSRRSHPSLLAFMMLSYLIGYLGAGRLMILAIRTRYPLRLFPALLVHLTLIALGTIVPTVFQLLLRRVFGSDYGSLQAVNWAWTIVAIMDNDFWGSGALLGFPIPPALVIVPLLAGLVFVANLMFAAKEVEQVRSGTPQRVLDEDRKTDRAEKPKSPWDEDHADADNPDGLQS